MLNFSIVCMLAVTAGAPPQQLAPEANHGSLYVDQTHIFYGVGSSVVRQNKAGGPPHVLVMLDDADGYVRAVVGSGSDLFFATKWALYRVPKTGGVVTPISKDLRAGESETYRSFNEVKGLAVDPDFVYVALGKRLMRLPRTGGAALALFWSLSSSGVRDVIIDGTAIHMTDNASVWRMSRAGGTPMELAMPTAGSFILALAQDEKALYAVAESTINDVIYRDSRGLFRIGKQDGAITLLGRFEEPRDVAVDQDNVYVADSFKGLLRMSKSGGSPDILLSTPCNTIVIDGTSIYAITIPGGENLPNPSKGKKLPNPLVRLVKSLPSEVPDSLRAGVKLTCNQGAYAVCMQECSEGLGLGCYEAATPYFDGSGGFQKNVEKAFALIKKGCHAKKPSAQACALLGKHLYNEGQTKEAREQAVKMMKRGCDLDAAQCYSLAETHMLEPKSAGVTKGFSLYKKACDGGNAKACLAVSSMLRNDSRVPKDEKAAQEASARACALEPYFCNK